MQKFAIFGKKFEVKYIKDKKHCNVRDHCYYTAEYRDVAHSLCNSKYTATGEISIVFHNRSNYNYHFIIKELAEEFEGQFSCLEESTKNT